eukprot:459029_1
MLFCLVNFRAPFANMMSCGMTMYFHWDSGDDCVLFKNWDINETYKYILTCFGLFFVCIIREFFLFVGKYYEIRTLSGEAVPFWPTFRRLEELSVLSSINVENVNQDKKAKLMNEKSNNYYHQSVTLKLRIIDCMLYGISLILGYSLMLVVMTFNTGLILVIICGYCVGRFLFHRQTKLLQRFVALGQKTQSDFEQADHCNIRS